MRHLQHSILAAAPWLLLAMFASGRLLAEPQLEWDSRDVLLSERTAYQYHKIGPEYAKPTDPNEKDPGTNFMVEVTLADEPPKTVDRVLKRGATLAGRIAGAPAAAREGRVWLEDNYGRALDEARVAPPDFAFTLGASRSLSMGLYLKARLEGDGQVLWSGQQEVRMVPPPEDPWRDFVMGIWNMGTKPGTGEWLREMGLGHRAVQTTGSPVYSVQNDLMFHPSNILYSLLGFYHRDLKRWREMKEQFAEHRTGPVALERHRCLSSPKEQEFIRIVCTAAARMQAPYEPLHYGIGDEIGIGNMAAPYDLCGSKHCLARCRQWLKDRYGRIEALNAQWGTSYEGFDEAEMFSVWQALDRAKTGNFSPWADRAEFMDKVLADAVALGVQAVRKVDPDARCSATGIQPPSTWGFDIFRLARTVDVMTPYDIGECPDIIAAFYNDGKDGKVVAPGFGDDCEGLWRTFLRGQAMAQQWDSFDDVYSKVIDVENGRLTPLGEKFKAFADWAHGGPGRLRNRADRWRDPVVILYSQPSIRGNWILEVTGRKDTVQTLDNWHERDSWTAYQKELAFRVRQGWAMWLRDIGIWPRYADTSQVDDGYLAKNDIKVLILPRAVALSDKTAKAIREFVAAGGTVIADSWCGIMDEHCRVRDRGILDDLFGVTRGDYRDIDGTHVPEDGKGVTIAETAMPFSAFEKTLKAVDGKAGSTFRGADAAVTRRGGKGRAIYLNFNLEEYLLHRFFAKMVEPARGYLLDLLADAGAKPLFVIRTPDDEDARFHPVGHDVAAYRSGRGWLVGVFMNPTLRASGLGGIESRYEDIQDNPFFAEHPLALRVPADLHVYDLEAGKALGKVKSVETISRPRAGRFYACWPFEIQNLSAEVKVTPDRHLKITGRIATSAPVQDEKLVVQVKAFRPDGSEQRIYRKVLDCDGAAFAADLPLGLNEHGDWTIVVREPCTGRETKVACALP